MSNHTNYILQYAIPWQTFAIISGTDPGGKANKEQFDRYRQSLDNLIITDYAVLHSPAYRERYREFLKIDFPRVPYPRNAEQFCTLAATGAKLRRLHMMEGVEPQSGIADFPTEGGNEIENLIIRRR